MKILVVVLLLALLGAMYVLRSTAGLLFDIFDTVFGFY